MKVTKKQVICIAFLIILPFMFFCFIYESRPFLMPDGVLLAEKRPYIHFSIDDCNKVFEDLTKNQGKYRSAFDQPVLGYLKELHDEYGIVVSCYVYYSWNIEEGRFQLSETTDYYKEELGAESDWLKFGFHAKDAYAYENSSIDETIKYYSATIDELIRITGNENSLDRFIRLDRYAGDRNTISELHSIPYGVIGLLTTSKPERQCYGLNADEMDYMFQNDIYEDDIGIFYTPTDVCIEDINNDNAFYSTLKEVSTQPRIVIFTHEWILSSRRIMTRQRVKRYMRWFAQFGYENNIPFQFPQQELFNYEAIA